MKRTSGIKITFFATILTAAIIPALSFATTDNTINASATSQIFAKAKKNENWKLAFLTGKNAQVVFMSVSPNTNPKNEIGMETHKFDQIIFIAEGHAKAVLNDKNSLVKSGDMIFIPQGTPHNIINLNSKEPLKIISIYSDTDIPANSTYKKKDNEPQT